MRARTFTSLASTGKVASDYIKSTRDQQKGLTSTTVKHATAGASEVLESLRSHRRHRESQYILTGSRVITAMDEQLRRFRTAGEEFADWITRGSHLSIPEDERRFTVLEILWDDQAIKVEDDQGHRYLVPFTIVRPWPKEPDE